MYERHALIALTEARYLGMDERTDALLDELNEIREELDSTPTWRRIRRWRLKRDLLSYVGELQRNERIRALRDTPNPGLESAFR
jgi:hypothetical protein